MECEKALDGKINRGKSTMVSLDVADVVKEDIF